jgi:hypothetical protein
MTIHSRPVIASLYSQSSLSPRSGTAFSSVSLSPGATFAVASGKDVLHVLRLNLDRYAADSNRLEEIRSIRISQVSLFFASPFYITLHVLLLISSPLWLAMLCIQTFYCYHSISNRQYKQQTLVEEFEVHIHTCGMRCGLRDHLHLLFQLLLQVGGGSTSMLWMWHGACLSRI